MAQRECTITRDQFATNAKSVRVDLNEHETVFAFAKEFSTGSLGWYASDKRQVHLADGTAVWVQVGVTLTIIGSKELPKAAA